MATRTRLSAEASDILKGLEKRTRLTPNVLARLALALSLEDRTPFSGTEPAHSGLEFNHSTLYGEHEALYHHLAIEWAENRKDPNRILRLHIERGAVYLRNFLAARGLADLAVFDPNSKATRRAKTAPVGS